MIRVVATFTDQNRANAAIKQMAEAGVSPTRLGVTTDDESSVTVSVSVDEAKYESTVEQMRVFGPESVTIDRSGRKVDTAGSPTLSDPQPPSPHGAGE